MVNEGGGSAATPLTPHGAVPASANGQHGHNAVNGAAGAPTLFERLQADIASRAKHVGTNGVASNGTAPPKEQPTARATSLLDPASKGTKGADDPQCLDWAKRLRDTRRKNGRQPGPSLEQSAESFRLLRDVDKYDVEANLTFYLLHCQSRTTERNAGLPSISGGAQFRRNQDWIDDQRVKHSRQGKRLVRETVDEVVWERGANGTLRSRVEKKQVERLEDGRWIKGDDGRRKFVKGDGA